MLWSAPPGSSEAAAALKRFQRSGSGVGVQTTNSKGRKRPILLVAYPASTLSKTAGSGKTVVRPQLLAQHHCTPPPAADALAAWLNALRQRHQPLYRKLQKRRQEVQWAQERAAGYKGSAAADAAAQKRREEEAAERKRQERANEAQKAAIQARRDALRAALPPEVDSTTKGVRTVALRFADGRTGQRRFAPDASLADVFNWIDALFEMERETITLWTMNGKQSFEWKDGDDGDDDGMPTLAEAGLGPMVGLRVMERKKVAANRATTTTTTKDDDEKEKDEL